MSDEITAEWLEVFRDDKAAGKTLADSVFWRLAVDTLPLGVDAENAEVQAALAEIRRSIELRQADRVRPAPPPR